MANTLTAIMYKIIARALASQRGRTVMPTLAYTDYSSMLAVNKGDTVNVPVPQPVGVIDITSGDTPQSSSAAAITTSTIPVVVNKWKGSKRLILSDQELTQIDKDEFFLPMQLQQASIEIVEQVNQDLFALYKDVYLTTAGTGGGAGTTPFASTQGVTPITNSMKVLNIAKAPTQDRGMVLNFDAHALGAAVPALSDSEKITSEMNKVKLDGSLGHLYGFDIVGDGQVPSHTAGSITTGLITKASTTQAIGVTAVVCTTAASTGACALVVGDIVTIAGNTYAVTATATQAAAATDVTVNITPGLKVATTGSDAVTVTASHVANLAFHKNAFALVTRPMADNEISGVARARSSAVMRDPITGLIMRLTQADGYYQTTWQLDMLYGVKTVRPEWAARLLG